MKNQVFVLFIAFAFCGILACSTDENVIDPVDPGPELLEGNVVLSKPEVGQTSYFVHYQASCEDVNGTFEFLKDTIALEVIESDGQLSFKEEYTEFSQTRVHNPTIAPSIYEIESIEDGLLIPGRIVSNLFYFYGNDTIRTNRVYDTELVQEDCLLMMDGEVFIGDETGHIESFQVGPVEIKDKTVVSCVPIFNLDGYLMYTDNHMYVSHTVTHSEFGGDVTSWISGWQMIQ